MKIAIINPPDIGVRSKDWFSKTPYLGIAYIAAFLYNNEFDVKVIDCKLQNITLRKLFNILTIIKPDILSFSLTTPDIHKVHLFCKDIKAKIKDTKIVVGGPHPTVMPYQTLKDYEAFDIAVMGEGEMVFSNVVSAILNNICLENIKGISFRNSSDIIVTEKREELNLDSLPFPAWELFPKADTYPVLISKGCPHNCVFCSLARTKIRRREPQKIVDEILYLIDNFKVKKINFSEENFGINQGKTQELLNLMISNKIHTKIKWRCITRVDILKHLMNQKILQLMKDAGCEGIALGIESGDERILKQIGKNTNINTIKEAIDITKRFKIDVSAQYVIGLPYENLNSVNSTVDLAVKLNCKFTNFNPLVPYPETQVFKMAEYGEGEYNFLYKTKKEIIENIEECIELKNLKKDQLRKIPFLAKLKFYLYNLRIFELIVFLWEHKVPLAKFMLKKVLLLK